MSQKYYTLLTTKGAALLANATALGTQLKLTHMAVGDANGSTPQPVATQTKLIHEVRRAAINTLFVDKNNPNQIIAEQVIPETEGGWFIHEIGLYDDNGNLIAVGNCPSTYKPQLVEGSGRTQVIRMILIIDNTDSVQLKIDPSVVLATREYVDDLIATKMTEHEKSTNHPSATTKSKGFVQLSSLTNSESEVLAATSKAVKITYDLAAGAVKKTGDTMTGPLGIKTDNYGLMLENSLGHKWLSRIHADNSYSISQYDSATNSWIFKLRYVGSANKWRFENIEDVTINGFSALKQGDGGLFSKAPVLAAGTDLLTDDVLSVSQTFTLSGAYVNSPDNTKTWAATLEVIRRYHDAGAGATLRINQSNNEYWEATAYKVNGVWACHGWVKQLTSENISNYLPVGIPQPWPTTTVPSGWLKCNGSSFNKTLYPKLAAAYPTGTLPDLRGEFIRGLDDGRGVDSARVILTPQGDAIRNIEGVFNVVDQPSTTPYGAFRRIASSQAQISGNLGQVNHSNIKLDVSLEYPTANENRSRNIAFLYIVKAE